MFIPNGLEETKSDKEGVQVGLFRCPPNEALASNLVAGLIAEDPGFLADLVRSISLPLGVGGQQVAVGVPVWQPEALTGLDAQCGHGAGVEGSEHPRPVPGTHSAGEGKQGCRRQLRRRCPRSKAPPKSLLPVHFAPGPFLQEAGLGTALALLSFAGGVH